MDEKIMSENPARPFTFVHGMNNDALVWAPVIAALGDRVAAAHAPDLPVSESIEEIADALAQQAPADGVVVGHSFGGAVAMAILDRHPDKVAALILVASSLGCDSPAQAAGRVTKADAITTPQEYIDFAVSLMPKVYHPENADTEQLRDDRRRSVGVYGLDRYRAHSRAIGARPDRDDVVAATAVPVLVIAPDGDTVITPDRQRTFADRVGADFRTVAHAGHMLPAERPAELAAVIADWLQDSAATSV